ncbi:hypothetical protein N431DRAFT_491713 [Stipitochalara longipes BDJ]|nr:hypothetical protein N431DRAFT_491713 [Stipitochalara longipes BDJ]
MRRGRGKAKSRGKGKAKNKEKEKSKQITISSWLGRFSSPEMTPEPEDPNESGARRKLRWLHAGVYEDIRSNAHDIWYAFKSSEKYRGDGYKIVYARDAEGATLGNYNVGQVKRNLITFDEHHLRKWRRFLEGTGTWRDGKATIGRFQQRKTLLNTWLDRSFIDPYPDGRRTKIIGPPLNVIHHFTDKDSTGMARASGNATPPAPPLTPDQCYPWSRIPLSTAEIKIDDFKNINEDSFKVISDFLTGRLNQQRNSAVQVDRIESAFYDQGWRVHRQAVEQALDDMYQDLGTTAFDSDAFLQNSPIRVDKFKGEEVEKLINKLSGKEPHPGSDSENDSENDQGDDSGDDDGHGNDEPRLFQEDDSDGFDFLPDDSPLKGKAPASRKRASREVVEVQDEVQNEAQPVKNIYQDDDHVEVIEDRSTPAPRAQRINTPHPHTQRVKSESPIIQSRWDNAIVIEDDSKFEDDSDVEFLEERIRPKTEPSDGIVDMIMVEDED